MKNRGDITIKYCPTDQMQSDYMTKPTRGRCHEDNDIFRDFTEKGYAQRNLEEQREAAGTLALERERLVTAASKKGGYRNLSFSKKKSSVKDDLIGRKLHREGRVAEAARKDKGIIPGEISNPEVVTAGCCSLRTLRNCWFNR